MIQHESNKNSQMNGMIQHKLRVSGYFWNLKNSQDMIQHVSNRIFSDFVKFPNEWDDATKEF
jgi:hypothetical protein